MKDIIVRCGKYDCYWNTGSEPGEEGNCSSAKVKLNLDSSQCEHYIERGKAQERLAWAFEAKCEKTSFLV